MTEPLFAEPSPPVEGEWVCPDCGYCEAFDNSRGKRLDELQYATARLSALDEDPAAQQNHWAWADLVDMYCELVANHVTEQTYPGDPGPALAARLLP